jgi:hypothetical protein
MNATDIERRQPELHTADKRNERSYFGSGPDRRRATNSYMLLWNKKWILKLVTSDTPTRSNIIRSSQHSNLQSYKSLVQEYNV